jgi:hypothetical protein
MVRSWITTVPRPPMMMSTTPFHTRNPASVTTNDGTPAFEMMSPWTSPMTSATQTPTATATYQGQSFSSRRARITDAVALT